MLDRIGGVGRVGGMRIPRSILRQADRAQVFHVISRVVDRRFIFTEKEKGVFLQMLRQQEGFSGVEVLAYCVMDNHFHLLLGVPARPAELSREEIRRRMGYLYSRSRMAEFDGVIEERSAAGNEEFVSEFYGRMGARMYDLSVFVKELKLRFSKWYNREQERKGTLWEERFRCVLVEGGGNATIRTAAYIELNGVRAGLAENPQQYRWCSYAEAMKGGKKARQGIIRIVSGGSGGIRWREAAEQYRSCLASRSHHGRQRSGPARVDGKEEQSTGRIQPPLQRVRYFTEGLVIGSREFLEEFLEKVRYSINPQRKRAGYAMRGADWDGLMVYRNVRGRPNDQ
jgi:REP element-mobilizing transposase RayT